MPALQEKPSYPIAAKLKGPGPGGYLLPGTVGYANHSPIFRRCPAFSFGISPQLKNNDVSPGPQAYQYSPKLTNRGTIPNPAFSMGARLVDLRRDKTPGPGAHNVQESSDPRKFRSPAWHMALPAPKDKYEQSPAPNAYEIPPITGGKSPNIPDPPKYTMRIKPTTGGFTQDFAKTPGAATYTAVDLERVKQRSPAYTMKDRRPPPLTLNVPGPNTYHPTMANKARSPAHHLGSKHSPYMASVKANETDMLLSWA